MSRFKPGDRITFPWELTDEIGTGVLIRRADWARPRGVGAWLVRVGNDQYGAPSFVAVGDDELIGLADDQEPGDLFDLPAEQVAS